MSRRLHPGAALVAAGALALSACSTSSGFTSSGSGSAATGKVITAAASINAWGSILEQLGGTHVRMTSIISSPDVDPHDYEPTPKDARVIADATLFVQNGIGYDSWAEKGLAANPEPDRTVLTVGDLVGVKEGGNPHQWYSPASVEKVADAITAALRRVDPGDAAYFDAQRKTFEDTGLANYHQLINEIKSSYAGTPVGASESIFSPLAEALGLDLVTPPSFLQAISEGTDPSASDKATVDAQLAQKKIKILVFNSQNATPDVSAQVAAAKKQRIPVSTVTETLSPKGASFQDWQSAQLREIATALAQASAT